MEGEGRDENRDEDGCTGPECILSLRTTLCIYRICMLMTKCTNVQSSYYHLCESCHQFTVFCAAFGHLQNFLPRVCVLHS